MSTNSSFHALQHVLSLNEQLEEVLMRRRQDNSEATARFQAREAELTSEIIALTRTLNSVTRSAQKTISRLNFFNAATLAELLASQAEAQHLSGACQKLTQLLEKEQSKYQPRNLPWHQMHNEADGIKRSAGDAEGLFGAEQRDPLYDDPNTQMVIFRAPANITGGKPEIRLPQCDALYEDTMVTCSGRRSTQTFARLEPVEDHHSQETKSVIVDVELESNEAMILGTRFPSERQIQATTTIHLLPIDHAEPHIDMSAAFDNANDNVSAEIQADQPLMDWQAQIRKLTQAKSDAERERNEMEQAMWAETDRRAELSRQLERLRREHPSRVDGLQLKQVEKERDELRDNFERHAMEMRRTEQRLEQDVQRVTKKRLDAECERDAMQQELNEVLDRNQELIGKFCCVVAHCPKYIRERECRDIPGLHGI